MAGCPRGVFAVIMSERVAELQRGAIRELEDGGWLGWWWWGEGPAATTHLGCSHLRAQERDRDGADVTQHQKYEDEADLWVDEVKPCALFHGVQNSKVTFDAERFSVVGMTP